MVYEESSVDADSESSSEEDEHDAFMQRYQELIAPEAEKKKPEEIIGDPISRYNELFDGVKEDHDNVHDRVDAFVDIHKQYSKEGLKYNHEFIPEKPVPVVKEPRTRSCIVSGSRRYHVERQNSHK